MCVVSLEDIVVRADHCYHDGSSTMPAPSQAASLQQALRWYWLLHPSLSQDLHMRTGLARHSFLRLQAAVRAAAAAAANRSVAAAAAAPARWIHRPHSQRREPTFHLRRWRWRPSLLCDDKLLLTPLQHTRFCDCRQRPSRPGYRRLRDVILCPPQPQIRKPEFAPHAPRRAA